MRQSILMVLIIELNISRVTSKSQCAGTCYSGRLFPEPQDIFHGKHLKGYSYINITTDDPVKCYSSCIQDCRCKACQMKDSRCELLDEDKTSRADDFVSEPGYVYFDIKQTTYQGKSHMVPPGSCYNGCCRSQPCMNGGTCEERCQTRKEKFTCMCSSMWYYGKLCEKRYPSSCLEILRTSPPGVLPADGNYTILRDDVLRFRTLYCNFVAPNKAWTLIESFSLANNKMFQQSSFADTGFNFNLHEPNWDLYRLNYLNIEYFYGKSTMFRITCDFPKRVDGILTPDYLFGYLSDYDILKYGDNKRRCFKFAHMNIRGYDFFNVSALPIHEERKTHFHIECSGKAEQCDLMVPGHIYNEDCFGYYKIYHTKSKCSESPDSTTQFWLGQEL